MSEKETKRFDLNHHIARLLMDEPFFAYVSRTINKSASTAIPTAGVRVNPETAQFEMLYNPEYLGALPDNQLAGVLTHEFYHIIFEHVTTRIPGGKMHMAWNVATDLAINSIIGRKNLPEGCCIPGVDQFANYPSHLSSEAYYEMLKNDEQFKNKQKQSGGSGDGEGEDGQAGDSNGQFDAHEGWGEVDPQTVEIAKERLKETMKKAAQECAQSNRWGSISADCRRDILKRLNPSIDWKKVLRYFCGQAQRADRTNTIRRINKRYPYIHSGKKINRVANIAISIDQSGSVSDQLLAAFYAELNKLSDLATFTVIPFDHRVDEKKVYVWKKGDKKKFERVLTGGTDFNAPTKYVNEHKFDGHIVVTDGYAPKPKRSNCKRMWILPESYKGREYFKTKETKVYVKEG